MSEEEKLKQVWDAVAKHFEDDLGPDDRTRFLDDVVEHVLFHKGMSTRLTKEAAIGLIRYGAVTEESLKAIANTKEKFRDALTAEGVPKAICDALFDKYVAPAQSTELPSIKKVCDAYIQKNVKLEKLPELENFELSQDSPFQMFAREDVKVPKMPDKEGGYNNRPYMLFHGLSGLKKQEVEEKEAEKKKAGVKTMYRYVSKNNRKGPTVIYATSGAGKTRGAFEYLCCNLGFYFTFCEKDNSGSGDMDHVLGYLEDLKGSELQEIKKSDDDNSCMIKNNANRKIVKQVLSCVFYVRWRVLKVLRDLFQETFKPYHWLLIQLHPRQFFDGRDVFRDMMTEITLSCAATTEGERVLLRLLKKINYRKCVLFVDETQILSEKMKEGYFISSNSTTTPRSAYSAFLGAFKAITESFSTKIGYPIMMGTGLSYSSIEKEKGSAMVKETLTNYVDMFSSLQVLDPEEVIAYIKKIANLDTVNEMVLNHVGRWLQGRPRWTATFLSLWMCGKLVTENISHNISMEPMTETLLMQIESYVELITRHDKENHRRSWDFSSLTPRTAISKLITSGSTNLKNFFEQAVLHFTLHGTPSVHGILGIDGKAKVPVYELVEIGIARCEKSWTSAKVEIKIDEPLIVEAAVLLYSVVDYSANKLTEAGDESTKGFLFEELLVPVLRTEFLSAFFARMKIEDQLEKLRPGEFKELETTFKNHKAGRSAYGVMATKCDNAEETIEWIEKSIQAPFDGMVTPFCLPDNLFGPDIVFFLRDPQNWGGFIPVLCQAKYRKDVNQVNAMRSVVPKLLYKKNRNKKDPVSSIPEQQQEKWNVLFDKLFFSGRTSKRPRNTFRVVLQLTNPKRSVTLGRVSIEEIPTGNRKKARNVDVSDSSNIQVVLGGRQSLLKLFPESVVVSFLGKSPKKSEKK